MSEEFASDKRDRVLYQHVYVCGRVCVFVLLLEAVDACIQSWAS